MRNPVEKTEVARDSRETVSMAMQGEQLAKSRLLEHNHMKDNVARQWKAESTYRHSR